MPYKRNAEIPWVDPESEYYDPTITLDFIGDKTELSTKDHSSKPTNNEEKEVRYEQLVCYWCKKPLDGLDWEGGSDYTEGKTAHIKCNADHKAQLKPSALRETQEEEREFSDDDPRSGEA